MADLKTNIKLKFLPVFAFNTETSIHLLFLRFLKQLLIQYLTFGVIVLEATFLHTTGKHSITEA